MLARLSSESRFVPVILQLALPSPLRRLFDYLPPQGCNPAQLKPGVRLLVPFGKREMVGVLVNLADNSSVPADKLRPAIALLESQPLLPDSVWRLALWCAQYYQHSLGDTLAWALPSLLRQGEPAQMADQWLWQAAPNARLDDPSLSRAPKQQQALRTLLQHPHGIQHASLARFDLLKATLDSLRAKQLVQLTRQAHQGRTRPSQWLHAPELPLNEEQASALQHLRAGLGRFQPYLLAGVTGSGKTEVYLQLIRQVLEQGQQVLVLIPEINLGPQTLQRFQQRFNARIAMLHSNLTDRERLDAWLKARAGELDIILGTRSALFTPLAKPGLIVVDEEHDASYKQQEGLRYHARDLAVLRARLENTPVLLGSATPSLESLHNAQQGRYALLRLTQRAGNAQPPKLLRLDIKSRPLDAGLSQPLVSSIRDTLAQGQQVLVFLNRRGFAPTLLCHHCGWQAECHRCDARLTLHQRHRQLRCHHCDSQRPIPDACPKCGEADLLPIGVGTERSEERLQRLFPDTPVLRIDRDSTRGKHSMQALFEQINSGKPCILLGTQMLAKGHHFPAVTLVAVLEADGGLFSADFRAAERMAQQIIQVAGRAGRAQRPGKVIIQSQLADHPLLVQLCESGYAAFAEQALAERRHAGLPPFTQMALLRAEANQAALAEQFLQQACDLAEGLNPQHAVELLGPVPAPMAKRGGRHRAQLLLLSEQRAPLHNLLAPWLQQLESLPQGRKVRWSLDVDPIDTY
ncbi:primosomal protein N' [Atopomonas sediminilitoris]|uniref:primosomal protein N' n=1 Tax=Atopomonas sediminilitoris TaxID=2919919 RepID=UPI001F4D989D|nr:primosomal protein N' [Atopomonas sediminilitoris]MCJ8170402.1 primosomal protein N' [Atopomonas sediminilitoris]